jgi:hypothetical protein
MRKKSQIFPLFLTTKAKTKEKLESKINGISNVQMVGKSSKSHSCYFYDGEKLIDLIENQKNVRCFTTFQFT